MPPPSQRSKDQIIVSLKPLVEEAIAVTEDPHEKVKVVKQDPNLFIDLNSVRDEP